MAPRDERLSPMPRDARFFGICLRFPAVRGAVNVIRNHEASRGSPVLGWGRCGRRAGLQPQPRRPKRRAAGDRPMERRWRLSVGGRCWMQSRGRLWPRPVPATHSPRRRYVRRRRHVPHRGWADLNRAGTAGTLLGRHDRLARDPERDAERIHSSDGLLDDADQCRNVPHSLPIATAVTFATSDSGP
jgi:hypothetical protein